MRSFLAAVFICGIGSVVTVTAADARSKSKRPESREIELLQRLLKQNDKLERELAAINKQLRAAGVVVASADTSDTVLPMPRRNPITAVPPMPIPDATKTLKGYEKHIAKSARLKDLTTPLAEKVAQILVACPGSRITSGYRPGARVAGSGKPSLHSRYPSHAADLAGNPGCIKAQLAKWPGGLSTDYSAVRHYHVSYDPKSREWGARFAHYRGGRHARHVKRYATATHSAQ